MKTKDMKMMVQGKALEAMPDIFEKLKQELVMIDIPTEKPSRRIWNFSFSKVLRFATIILMLGITSIFVYNQLQTPTTVVFALETEAEILGFPAISGAVLMDEFETTPLSMPLALPLADTPTSPLIESELDQLNKYLNSLEAMIGDKSTIAYTISQTDNAEYFYKLQYQTYDVLENELTSQVHYNMTSDETTDSTYHMDAIMPIGSIEYQLSGTRKDLEKSSSVNWTIALDAQNYITIEDLSTNSKQLFAYSIYQNGILEYTNELELSLKDNQVVGNLTVQSNDCMVEYRIERSRFNDASDKLSIQYTYQSNGNVESGNIDVEVETDLEGNSQFNYSVRGMGSDPIVTEYQKERGNRANNDSNPDNDNPGPGGHNPGPGHGNQ